VACSGLDHMWSEDAMCINAPMKSRVASRGQWPWSSTFASFLLLLLTCHSCQISPIVHSVMFVLPTIFEKYIHTKIEANLLKSVAYNITPEMHVPLFNHNCANYFIARRQIRCYWTVTLRNRGLSVIWYTYTLSNLQ